MLPKSLRGLAMMASSDSHRVVVTGVGVVSPIGIGQESFWQNLIAGRSGIDVLTAFPSGGLPSKLAAEVRDFDPVEHIYQRKFLKVMSRDIQLGVAAPRWQWCCHYCLAQSTYCWHSEASNFVDSLYKEDVGVQPALKTGKLDTGSWLLHGIFARHDSWERLGSLPQGTFGCLSDLSARRYHVIKRSCDVVGSLFFLIMLFPVGLMVAILIKFDSSGPVYFGIVELALMASTSFCGSSEV